MNAFQLDQKWISTAEPELGMGRVTQLSPRTVSLTFDRIKEDRTYAIAKAPLVRVKFSIGDLVTNRDNITICVTSIEDKQKLFTYSGPVQGIESDVTQTELVIKETDLNPTIRFSKPEDRLLTHQLDENAWFNLRFATLKALADLAVAPSRGLHGPRVALIPHQLYIGNEVAERFAPRVLLADEVGLGKTIEAGLIIHQQLITGRARRVLIIVPPALSFQWFVEMIRRFNLHFTLLDETRCQNIVADNTSATDTQVSTAAGYNPFEAQQLMICNLELFLDNPQRLAQVLNTEWDLVVVDEAHHLQWAPSQASPAYEIVERISAIAAGLLLLTATPEQLGRAGHFARLRLLDPARYDQFDQFLVEEESFVAIASLVTNLLEASKTQQHQARTAIKALLGQSDEGLSDSDLIDAVLDRHGTGRVLFRNVRASVKGFPQRHVLSYPLPVAKEFSNVIGYFPEQDLPNWTLHDPRISWLATLLHSHPLEKFLLICAHQQTALDLEQCLLTLLPIRTTVFHEGMDLVARDRAANYFAETDRGAQLMICSEIGSEGRNFQFASHLVLFDLPLGPDLLEQRIGRLDRIGQTEDVKIHIPYLKGSATERLYQWYAEGLDLFVGPSAVAQGIFDELLAEFTTADLATFIPRCQLLNRERSASVQQGRDRLLELNSHRPVVSAKIIADIQQHQGGQRLEQYMERSFAMFGLESEPLGNEIYLVKPGAMMVRHVSVSAETQAHFHYPEIPEEGLRITYDRETALAREDVQFLTWEHPLVQQALDLVATDTHGNSTMIAVKHSALAAGTLLLETLFVADCIAPAGLMADRFLPPTVIRVLIEPKLSNITALLDWSDFETEQLSISIPTLQSILESQRDGIKSMLETAKHQAQVQCSDLRLAARSRADAFLSGEIHRMTDLQRLNQNIRLEEIKHLRETRRLVLEAIDAADIRLDAIRVIVAA